MSLIDWFSPAHFMPHGHCYLWRPDVLWLHVGSDAVIAGSYYAIPVALAYFVRQRRAVLPYWWVPALFAMFIFLCGSTHLMNIWTVWNPDYRVDGLLKLATAIASAGTAFLVFASLPQALALRTPIELQAVVDQNTAQLMSVNARLREEVEAHKRTEAALRQSEARFRATFENAAVGIAHVSPDGRWLRVNAGLCSMIGYSREELLSRTFGEITHPEDLQSDLSQAQRLLAGEIDQYAMEKRYIRKDGSTVWVMLTVSLIREPGGAPAYFISVVDDITDRKRLEIELRRTIQRLAETDRRKDEFLATLAHELRNPLAPIANGVQILKMPSSAESVRKRTTDIMERQIKHLVRLVDDLLDVSRITRGKLVLRMQTLRLQDVISAALESTWTQAEAGRLELTVQLPEQPMPINGDLDRLTQVFSNIISNAAKYTPDGGSLWIGGTLESGEAIVRVKDTGIGIPPESLEQVFEMFSQLPAPNQTDGGLGIGLALVRQLVRLHGGSVEARSEGIGRGSEFVIRLPMAHTPRDGARTNGADTGQASPEPAAQEAPRSNPLRILVVDDNRDSADSLQSLLSLMGHHIHKAADGHGAVEAVRAFLPSIVFMDIGMPHMDGLEATRRIRELPLPKQPLIVALTGWGQEADRERSRLHGVDVHLIKPIDPEALRKLLQSTDRSVHLLESFPVKRPWSWSLRRRSMNRLGDPSLLRRGPMTSCDGSHSIRYHAQERCAPFPEEEDVGKTPAQTDRTACCR